MWEPHRKHKLKKDAIPTIFGFLKKKQVPSKNMEIEDSIVDSNADKIIHINNTSEPTTDDVTMKDDNFETVNLLLERIVSLI